MLQDFQQSFAKLKAGRGAVDIGLGRRDFALDDKPEGFAQMFALRKMGDELLEGFRRASGERGFPRGGFGEIGWRWRVGGLGGAQRRQKQRAFQP